MEPQQKIIDAAWEQRASLTPANAPGALREAVEHAIAGLDSGKLRVAENPAASGSPTSGSRKPCCFRSGSRTTASSKAAGPAIRQGRLEVRLLQRKGFRERRLSGRPPAAARRGASSPATRS